MVMVRVGQHSALLLIRSEQYCTRGVAVASVSTPFRSQANMASVDAAPAGGADSRLCVSVARNGSCHRHDLLPVLVIGGLQSLIPFAADAWLARRIRGIASTLVFPCTWTALDYLTSFGSFGSWGAAGYSQYGELPLLQILSVTGLWGLTFLIGWFASACSYLWDEGYNSRPARNAVYLCLATIAAVILIGDLRLSFFPPSSETVRIASLSKRPIGAEPDGQSMDRLLANKAASEDFTKIRKWTEGVNDDLLVRADREGQDGAKIVFWAEGNALVLKQDEATLLGQGSKLAVKDHIYLGMALAVLNPGESKPLENKFVVAGPDGKMAMDYYKAHPVPGDEAAMSVTKDGRLQVMETPFGRISAVICFDADFPQLLAQAGARKADIVLDPSNDWRAIDPWHTEMASFRAIEEGINLDRQTSHGLSEAFDYQGRTLAALDYYHSSDDAMVADLPTRSVRTIYSRFGDWFAWLTIAGSLALIVAAFCCHSGAWKNRSKSHSGGPPLAKPDNAFRYSWSRIAKKSEVRPERA